MLCARIEQWLSGQTDWLEPDCPAAVETEAQRVAAQLLARAPASPEETLPRVAVDSLALLRPWPPASNNVSRPACNAWPTGWRGRVLARV